MHSSIKSCFNILAQLNYLKGMFFIILQPIVQKNTEWHYTTVKLPTLCCPVRMHNDRWFIRQDVPSLPSLTFHLFLTFSFLFLKRQRITQSIFPKLQLLPMLVFRTHCFEEREEKPKTAKCKTDNRNYTSTYRMYSTSIANTSLRVKIGNLSNTKQDMPCCLTSKQWASSNYFVVWGAACSLNTGRNRTSLLQKNGM